MEFGMPTLIENKDIHENITLCKNLGFDFIEFNMNLPEYQIEQVAVEDGFIRFFEKVLDLKEILS